MTDRPEGTPEEPPAEPTEATDAMEPEAATEPEETPEAAGALEPAPEPEAESGLEAERAPEPEPADDANELAIPVAVTAGAAVGAAARRRGPVLPGPRVATPSERAVKIGDQASRYFVIASVAVFAAILLFGLVGGKGGFLTTTPAPASASPSASASAAASSPAASASTGASVSPVASPSAIPSVAISASPS